MEFNIQGFEDRRKLVGILADNGYTVTVEERKNPEYYISQEFFVIVTLKQEKGCQEI